MASELRTEQLRCEARLFGRHLLDGEEPAEELIERYVVANQLRLQGLWPSEDHALVTFVLRHPWSLPLLDAAAGLTASRTLLRSKLLVFIAILEASPYFVERFMPKAASPLVLLRHLVVTGLLLAPKALIGLLLMPIA